MARTIATVATACAVLAPAGLAQTLAYETLGSHQLAVFANSLAALGDVNGDGVADFAVGSAGEDDVDGLQPGSARIFSGTDGTLLFALWGDNDDDAFGLSVAGPGDIDGDGYGDILIGIPGDDTMGLEAGSAVVYSGATGTLLYQVYGANPSDVFGLAVGAAGDIDDDGYRDFVIGAPLAISSVGDRTGIAYVFSGRDGGLLHTLEGVSSGDHFGFAVGAAGDVNGDGYDDIIVGAPMASSQAGAAYVYSGQSAAQLLSLTPPPLPLVPGAPPPATRDCLFGFAVAGVGDLDGDDRDDIAIGAPEEDGAESGTSPEGAKGTVRVYSGDTGNVLWSATGTAAGTTLGFALAAIGDVDGDGHRDIAVGAPTSNQGSVNVYSGDGTLLFAIQASQPSAEQGFGAAIAALGDIDMDNFDDLLVGAPGDDTVGTEAGKASAYLSDATGAAAYARWRGAGCPGSDGRLPNIRICGRPALGTSPTIGLHAARASASVMLLMPGIPAQIDLGPAGAPGCSLLSDSGGQSIPATTDGLGRASLPYSLPNDPAFVGIVIASQWVVADPVNALGLTTSNAIDLTLGF